MPKVTYILSPTVLSPGADKAIVYLSFQSTPTHFNQLELPKVKKTDLENYVENPEREELIRKVRKKIDELGIKYIYYQFISVTGELLEREFLDHWERTANRGFPTSLWFY